MELMIVLTGSHFSALSTRMETNTNAITTNKPLLFLFRSCIGYLVLPPKNPFFLGVFSFGYVLFLIWVVKISEGERRQAGNSSPTRSGWLIL